MHQYFNVGEVVILDSKTHPEYNGEYVVEKFLCHGSFRKCRVSGSVRLCGVYGYILNIPLAHKENLDAIVSSSSLRKKHKPSEFSSLSELINSTKEVKA